MTVVEAQGTHGLQRNVELQSGDFYLEREREWFSCRLSVSVFPVLTKIPTSWLQTQLLGELFLGGLWRLRFSFRNVCWFGEQNAEKDPTLTFKRLRDERGHLSDIYKRPFQEARGRLDKEGSECQSVDDSDKVTQRSREEKQELLTLRQELFAPDALNLLLSEIPENRGSRAGILNLSTFDILAQIVLCCGGRDYFAHLAGLAAALAFTQ
uniref:uncharacterized protein LOC118530825 n=1 Tax=Halichoerus grypus TaxID=9711 RepID=UPI00165936AC|nr:uncharacterized protein LOC118530825 [Halichoerus grypus]XP_035940389.1 uncharacterized protein LOC118530825 [Halichoerus grypus]XP_035940390.1 uncharacterized protein LOC118530825 [Halichoerus grypus]XP_035940391.1 uncharacterized protein LOC118530825 [Halichoerus grypus]XP_035940392.1 uncharacterized protein LOC118530825 [Halichoerus grypus]